MTRDTGRRTYGCRGVLPAALVLICGSVNWAQSADPPVRTVAATADAAADDRLATVLANWTTVGQRTQTLACKFVRSEFDVERGVETRGQGVVHYERGGRAVYAIEPVEKQPGLRSSRATNRGVPYQIAFPKAEVLYWVSGQIARINPERMEYELFEVPEHYKETGVVEAVDSFDLVWTRLGCLERQLPGLIETDVDELHERYDWTLESISERQIVLKGVPKDEAEMRHSSQLVVYLDPRTYFTQGTKMIDATQANETLHVFSDMKVNTVPRSDLPDWAPNIGGMTLLTPPPLAPPADE